MLRFIKQNLETITGVEIFPLISLVMFTAIFLGAIVLVLRMKKSEVAEMSCYPLNDGVVEDQSLPKTK